MIWKIEILNEKLVNVWRSIVGKRKMSRKTVRRSTKAFSGIIYMSAMEGKQVPSSSITMLRDKEGLLRPDGVTMRPVESVGGKKMRTTGNEERIIEAPGKL